MLKLLLPIDGSERSKQSIDWINKRYSPSADVELTLLIVREDIDYLRSKEQIEEAKKEALPILLECSSTLKEFNLTTEVRFGRAGEEILTYAEDNKIDVIVMTKSTKSGWISTIGSVTTHVVKYAKCVVVIVPELDID